VNDIIVSIRVPESILPKLKDVCKKNHFLDTSELIRSIIRKKWVEAAHPELYELKKLRSDIGDELHKQATRKAEQEVVKELEKIRASLKHAGVNHEK